MSGTEMLETMMLVMAAAAVIIVVRDYWRGRFP
jgi:hypothetical protein